MPLFLIALLDLYQERDYAIIVPDQSHKIRSTHLNFNVDRHWSLIERVRHKTPNLVSIDRRVQVSDDFKVNHCHIVVGLQGSLFDISLSAFLGFVGI